MVFGGRRATDLKRKREEAAAPAPDDDNHSSEIENVSPPRKQRLRRMRCGIANHNVNNPVYITDQHQVSFVRRLVSHFKPDDQVCASCRDSVMKAFKVKIEHAREHARMRRLKELNTISSLENSSSLPTLIPSSQSQSQDSFDVMVTKTPRHPSLKQVSNEINASAKRLMAAQQQQQSSRNNSIVNTNQSSAAAAKSLQSNNSSTSTNSDSVISVLGNVSSDNDGSTDIVSRNPVAASASSASRRVDDEQPTTSAAAAKGQLPRRSVSSAPPHHIIADESSIDSEYMPSPNALNGTRLPHIQPIPKRTQFVSANKDIMDIYLAGITGG